MSDYLNHVIKAACLVGGVLLIAFITYFPQVPLALKPGDAGRCFFSEVDDIAPIQKRLKDWASSRNFGPLLDWDLSVESKQSHLVLRGTRGNLDVRLKTVLSNQQCRILTADISGTNPIILGKQDYEATSLVKALDLPLKIVLPPFGSNEYGSMGNRSG